MCILTHPHNKQHTCSICIIHVQKTKCRVRVQSPVQSPVQVLCGVLCRVAMQGLCRVCAGFGTQTIHPVTNRKSVKCKVECRICVQFAEFFVSPFIYVQCRIETHFFRTLHSGDFGSVGVQGLCLFSNQGLLCSLAQSKTLLHDFALSCAFLHLHTKMAAARHHDARLPHRTYIEMKKLS